MFHWTINRKDEKGAAWTMSGYSFPKTASFEVAAGKPAVLEIGEPVQAVLKADENPDREITFSLRFEGRQKESIEMLRGGAAPARSKIIAGQRRRDGVLHQHVRVWVRRRLFALMAGAKKCSASVDRSRENRQPLPGAGESVDAGTKKIKLKTNIGVVGRVTPCAPRHEVVDAAGRGLPPCQFLVDRFLT